MKIKKSIIPFSIPFSLGILSTLIVTNVFNKPQPTAYQSYSQYLTPAQKENVAAKLYESDQKDSRGKFLIIVGSVCFITAPVFLSFGSGNYNSSENKILRILERNDYRNGN